MKRLHSCFGCSKDSDLAKAFEQEVAQLAAQFGITGYLFRISEQFNSEGCPHFDIITTSDSFTLERQDLASITRELRIGCKAVGPKGENRGSVVIWFTGSPHPNQDSVILGAVFAIYNKLIAEFLPDWRISYDWKMAGCDEFGREYSLCQMINRDDIPDGVIEQLSPR